jgi:hypothetical protein
VVPVSVLPDQREPFPEILNSFNDVLVEILGFPPKPSLNFPN